MPEKTGTVTGLITNPRKNNEVFGLNIDGSEYVYSFEQYRGEPFEDGRVRVGDTVRVEYQDTEKAGKTKSYISVLEVQDQAPEPGPEAPQTLPVQGQVGQPTAQRERGFEQKDKIGLMQTCLNVYGDMWTAALNAGSASKVPEPTTIATSARALWKEALEAIE